MILIRTIYNRAINAKLVSKDCYPFGGKGNISAQRAEEKEIHPKVLQKMYRHESVLTTMQYQSNFSFKKADEAIDAVLDF